MNSRKRVLAVALSLVMAVTAFAFAVPSNAEAASKDTSNMQLDEAVDSQGNVYVSEEAATDGENVTAEVEEGLAQDFELYALSTDYNDKVFSQIISDVVNQNTVTYDKASELARMVNLGYSWHNSVGPISISKAVLTKENTYTTGWLWNKRTVTETSTDDVYVVGMSGTDPIALNSTTGVVTDLLSGFEQDNLYVRNIKKVIFENIPEGSKLIVSGHSLGGMVSQQIAADADIKDAYEVVNVVTFGSPLLNGVAREGQVQRLGDTSDVVPILSVNTFKHILWQVFGLNREDGGYFGRFITAHCQSYQRDDVWGGYDVTGVKGGNATLTVDYSTTQFFSSPIIITK
ncbi:MAG: hypothetical protein K5644_08155 [Lachnospiraceae bacterium]|nr:hypothetical protein [Lachnospiraceae bacterium]